MPARDGGLDRLEEERVMDVGQGVGAKGQRSTRKGQGAKSGGKKGGCK